MAKNFFDLKDYNKPLYESENFVVIPSLGALIEGWLLIIPKNFYLNFSQLKETYLDELNKVIDHINERFLPLFESDSYVIFEHGPSSKNSLAGCGVDYAHLHWVPTTFDLLNGTQAFLNLNFNWSNISNIQEIAPLNSKDQDYLYLKNQQDQHFITFSDLIPSQTFRKVIAHYIECPDSFDWKIKDGMKNIETLYEKANLIKL